MDNVLVSSTLEFHEGRTLLVPLALRIAANAGCCALVIKGVAANCHGTRAAHASSDVDVWVEPSQFRACIAAFRAAGWAVLGDPAVWQLAHSDSVTLRHPVWPTPVDLHRRFTGFTADDSATFEAIWAERCELEVAGVNVAAAGPAATVLIQALHALRDPELDLRDEFGQARSWLLAAPHEQQTAVVSLAEATGALGTGGPLLVGLSDLPPDVGDLGRRRQFELRAARGGNFAIDYVVAARCHPVWRWPWLALRFLVGSEYTLRRHYPHAPPGSRGLWQARWWRLRDSVRLLPDVVRILWRHRRGAG